MSNADDAREAYEDMPIESIIALNAAANYLARVPNASKHLQYVSDTIVKYLRGEEPSLDRAFGGRGGIGISASKHEGVLEASVAVETDVQRWVAAAIELLQTVPVVEDKPIQAVPKSFVEAVKSDISVAEREAPSPTVEKIFIAMAANESQQLPPKTPRTPIAAVVALLVIALGASGYFLVKEQSLINATESAGASNASVVVVSSEPVGSPVATEVPSLAQVPSPKLPPAMLPEVRPASPPKQTSHVAKLAKEPEAHEVTDNATLSKVLEKGDAQPVQAPFQLSLSLAPLKEQKTLDEQYNERAAIECRAGLLGLFCRESMRLRLCAGKWAEDPPSGQTMCQQKSAQKL